MTTLIDVIALSEKNCVTPLQGKLAYATTQNFSGTILDGYHPQALDIFLLTPKAAAAVCQAQNHLVQTTGYGLFIFDSYRPKRAVNHLMRWAALPSANALELERKALHYPHLEKNQLFPLRYIAEDSGHCYGNTIDVVLVQPESGTLLNMGSIFDFLGEQSHLSATPEQIGLEAYQHRKTLVAAMELFGFHPYAKEYWHFAHGGAAGREVSQPFDIEITADLKGIGVNF